jgi:Putative adhesin
MESGNITPGFAYLTRRLAKGSNPMKTFALCLSGVVLSAGLAAAAEGSFSRSLAVSGPVELEVETDSGGIIVTPGSSGTVQVHAVLKAEHGWFGGSDVESRIRELERHPPIEQSGNRVRVGHVTDRELLRGISMRLEIQTPPDTQLRAHADSGGIRAEGLRGPVECKTDSGGIQIRDVQANVRAAADSGGIHIANVHGSVAAHADSGGIEANDVSGNLEAQADSGGIHLSQTNAAPIHAKADSGGVTVRLAENAGYELHLESDSGRISVPEMTVKSGFSQHHIEGKVRGGGPLVEVSVSSGNISIE